MWILLAATPAFADGGPHTRDLNNGSLGLAGDCAACHRAHQSTATDLLKSSQPGLCLSCHNGLGATADVVDGVQYTPTGDSTYQQTTVLGALRGGGFEYALLNTAAPDRLSYGSRGGITVTLSNVPTAGSVTLTFPAFTGFAGGAITIDWNESATSVQTEATTVFGTDDTYRLSTDTQYMSGLPVGDSRMVVTKASSGSGKDKVWTFALHDGFRLVEVPLPTVSANTLTYASGSVGVTVANGVSVGNTARVETLETGQAVTSTHGGRGTVWGNGAQGIGTAGATGVELECTSCHNPHGNGQYRILQTLPGESWADGTVATSALASDITAGATSLTLTSATGFPATDGVEKAAKYYIQIENEKMYVTAGFGTTTLTVTRGALSTTAAAHTATTAVKFISVGWTDPTVDVEVIDGPALAAGEVHNYTVKAGYTTDDVVDASVGDYWRYKWDPAGAANFTNFYLLKDPMNSGWDGQTPTNAASIESIIAAEPTTTLTAALGAYSATYGSAITTITVASVAGFPTHDPSAEPQPQFVIQIDSELMTASVDRGTANTLKLSRGFAGTAIAAHSSGATVTVLAPEAVDDAGQPVYNSLGRMTAFCIACHTRYNGWRQNGTPSLVAQTPMDAIFGYKHGTTSTGCEQCHVNHGTNAAMTGVSATVLYPDGTLEGSALLKVNNRGTCQLCHDPTGTIPINNQEGTVPSSIKPQ